MYMCTSRSPESRVPECMTFIKKLDKAKRVCHFMHVSRSRMKLDHDPLEMESLCICFSFIYRNVS